VTLGALEAGIDRLNPGRADAFLARLGRDHGATPWVRQLGAENAVDEQVAHLGVTGHGVYLHGWGVLGEGKQKVSGGFLASFSLQP
jgi:hypothetical protein